MKKKYSLILIAFLCFVVSGYGQIITFDFNGLTGSEASATSNFNNPNLSNSTITRGAGLVATNNGNRFNANNWASTDIATAIAGNDYMEFTITPNATYQFNVTTIDVNFERSGTGPRGILLRSSLDGYATDIDTEKSIADNGSSQAFTFTVGQTGNTAAVTYRIYGWAEATGGTGGFEGTGNDIVVNGSVNSTCTDAVDFERLVSPTISPDTILQGDPFPVTTLATEPGVTGMGGAPGLEAWIGYSTVDNDPSTSSGWTWVVATYSGGAGNTDEHTADIGSCLAPGTYYYASRHRLNGCVFTYGGDVTSGSFWNNNSQVLIVNGPAAADVVITEIMYNSSGTDDEWIEICNVSGSNQFLNNYTIEVGGTTQFTFPACNVELANGDCITVSLGDGGGANYNPDCPFTPDYTNGSGTGTLNNTSDTISLIASDGTTTIDTVTYDDGDGADNTGESLHIVDTSLDNSVTNTNWWEVINGGSPGVNSLISPCTPVGPEINVEGNTGNFPDIADGDTTPIPFDGTDFGDVNVSSTLTNSFRIENFSGTQNLNLFGVSVLSGDTGDFSITALPSSPITPADPNGFSLFSIQFQPTVPGTRTAIIEIRSNDGNEDPYTFTVTGNGLCVASAITASPTFGPENTIVTVTGTNLATATASFNGLAATVNNISATEMEVTVPAGATTGNLEIFDSLGCPGSTPFTVIDSEISSCEGSGGTLPTDLFISELTDASLGGLTYIELYNGTGAGINIDNYSIEVIANGAAAPSAFNIFDLENVTITSGSTYVIAIGRQDPPTSTNACTSITGGSGELASSANVQFSSGGINKKTNEHDVIRLVNSGTIIDEFGVYQDNDWMDSTIITGDRGFNFRRLNTATTLPDPTFTLAELSNWTIIDWVGSGASSCSGNDYSDIGLFDFSIGTPPIINSISSNMTACNEATISVSASEGFGGGNALQYFWYFYNPAQAGLEWQAISTGGIYTTDPNSPNLIISDAASVETYQFYCEVREDDSSCYTASDAIKVIVSTAIWDGTNWNWNDGTAQNTVPNIATNVIINGGYDTSVGGFQTSFSACNLTINNGAYALTINDGNFVQVENDVINNGNISISTAGSLVQISDTGTYTLNPSSGANILSKSTSFLQFWYEYTYWSSPLQNAQIETALFSSNPNRRHYFDASLYNDILIETANTNTFVSGHDDIDDEGDDWVNQTAGNMIPGVGYASTHNNIAFMPSSYTYIFEGNSTNGQGGFNTGDINLNIYITPAVSAAADYNSWNFIGNPYPSAISAATFFEDTASFLEGVIYLWSHVTNADANTSGDENANFSQDDYAMLNYVGGVAVGANAPNDPGNIPDPYIASGQGFFVIGNKSHATSGSGYYNETVFNNSMRVVDNNNQFFRTASDNKLWINLTSDNGLFSQILVGYLGDATDNKDAMSYDAPRNLSTNTNAMLYTLIPNSDKKFAIQGKSPNSLNTEEVIPLGFYTSTNEPTIYTLSIAQLEGSFMNENSIYLIDRLNNVIHELGNSNYAFTSEIGEFNERFEIVFSPEALSIDDTTFSSNELSIIELTNGDVKFKVGSQFTITKVEILDVLGRQVYTLKGNSSEEVYNLSKLSNAAYVAKVTLSNGQIISKKAIKQR